MRFKLLGAALVLYLLAVAIAASTAPAKRIYWPLYLGPAVAAAIGFSRYRRE